MSLRDAFGDRQAEADACVAGAYAFGAALERVGILVARPFQKISSPEGPGMSRSRTAMS